MTTTAPPYSEIETAAPALDRRLDRASLGAVMLGHMAVDMQTSSLAVLLPPLLAAFRLSYASAAGIISANNLIIAVAQPLFGLAGDFRRARWLVPAGLILAGLAMAAVLYLPAYGLVLAAVILSGLGSAAFHPEALSIVRGVSGDRTATGSSFFFFAGNLGFAFGPLAAALLLERWGRGGAAWMLLPVLVGIVALWSRRGPLRTAGEPAARPAGRPGQLQRPSRRTVLAVGYLLLFIAVRLTVTGGLQTFIPLYFSQPGGLDKAAVARLLTTLSIAGTLGTLFSGPLAERLGRRRVIAVSMALALGALAVFIRSAGLVQVAALAVAGATLSVPWTLSVIMVQDALPEHVGLASGLTLGTAYGAMGLGVAGLGQLADWVGLGPTLSLITLLPAAVLLMGLFVPERRPGPRPASA
ncbi:MAG: MFS transporter [Anaerolineales bacterium]|nr:MFS transporter [Anaerolineales bacterium]